MHNQRTHAFFSIFLLYFLIATASAAFGQSQTNPRAEWFTDARFGMFIHWGVYSGAEGVWKGEKLRNGNDYAEWIYYRNRIEKDEYLTLLDRFDWDEIDPEEWVLLAKKSGMKYLTFTAKHHDGFALWDSQVSDYDVAEHTNPKRDIVKELAEACEKHGIKLALYYSHWVDWEHPYGWDHTKEIYPITAEQYNQYWQEKVMPQMRELLTDYGPISMIWFDMWLNHSETIVTQDQLLQLKGLIRKLQPECLVNSRLGLSIEEDSDVDYRTLGDNQLGDQKLDYPWQSPGTVAHSWGFNRVDTEWKSTTSLLKALIGNASLNGNYMLNIGPRANGNVPYEIEQRMLGMGQWLEVNGEAVYNTEAFDLPKDQHDWGKMTYRKTADGRHKLYLHVYTWPFNHRLPVTGIGTEPMKAYVLRDKLKTPLEMRFEGAFTEITLPQAQPDPLISVVVLEYADTPQIVQGLTAKTVDGGFPLTPDKATTSEGNVEQNPYAQKGTVPPHLVVRDDYTATWKVMVDVPGTYHVDVSYSFQGEKAQGDIEVSVSETTLPHAVAPTGLTVVEPNQDYHIDDFASHRIGKVTLPKTGVYEVSIKVESGKKAPVKFQWIWLERE